MNAQSECLAIIMGKASQENLPALAKPLAIPTKDSHQQIKLPKEGLSCNNSATGFILRSSSHKRIHSDVWTYNLVQRCKDGWFVPIVLLRITRSERVFCCMGVIFRDRRVNRQPPDCPSTRLPTQLMIHV